MAVKMNATTYGTHKDFRKNIDIRKKMRHGTKERHINLPPEDFAYGIRNRTPTPIKDVINNGYVVTTEARAKEARKFVERMITYGKKGTLVSRRKALAFLHNDKDVVAKVFNELAPKYADRNGGYTRIIKLKERVGDDALTVKLELV